MSSSSELEIDLHMGHMLTSWSGHLASCQSNFDLRTTGRPNKTAWLEIVKKQTPIIKKITEPKINFIIFWDFFLPVSQSGGKNSKVLFSLFLAL